MKNYFYHLWLPISIVVHVMLMTGLYFMPLEAKQSPGLARVELIRLGSEPIQHDIVPPPPAVKPPVEETIVPPTMIKPEKHGRKPEAAGISNPVPSEKPTGDRGAPVPDKRKGPSGEGTGSKPAPAPAITPGNNNKEVPIGKDGGNDTGGDGQTKSGGGGGGGETRGTGVISIGQAFYPKDALNEGRSGTVAVLVAINADGLPTAADVSSSSGYGDLDAAARKAAVRSRFTPALKNGQPVSSSHRITYYFRNGRVSHD